VRFPIRGRRVYHASALPDDLPLYIDGHVMTQDTVVIGGGSRSMKIKLAPAGLLRLPGARVIEGLASVMEAQPA
jgi:prolyl-tRNA editing enzyme YbaK/EbsC (Cys-tRNA(Pro) deacylase)